MKDRQELRESFIKGVMPYLHRVYLSDKRRQNALQKMCCLCGINVNYAEYADAMAALHDPFSKRKKYVYSDFDRIDRLVDAERALRLYRLNRVRYEATNKEKYNTLAEKHCKEALTIIKSVFPNGIMIGFDVFYAAVFEYDGKTYHSLEHLINEVLL